MSNKITDRINNSLLALFDTTRDEIYKSVICDDTGTIPSTITRPDDIDVGAVTSEIEYLRLLSKGLVNQLYIENANGLFLKFIMEDYFDCFRLLEETESEWIQREFDLIFRQKVSIAALFLALSPYSTPDPKIELLGSDEGFSDLCFADRYTTYTTTYQGDDFHVFSAKASLFGSSYFTLTITIYNSYGMLKSIQKAIGNTVAAGINYNLKFVVVRNAFHCTGDMFVGVTLSSSNVESGTIPAGWYAYNSFLYNAQLYQPTAAYETDTYENLDGFTSILWTGTGDANDIRFQYRSFFAGVWGEWTTAIDAIGVKTVSLSGTKLQFRWIFYSPRWTDTDNFIVTEII